MASSQSVRRQEIAAFEKAVDAPRSDNTETPSGKGHNDENFPVGSFLLPPRLRPHVMAYYAFARAADDIADNAGLSVDEKIARLNAFEEALKGTPGYGDEFHKAHRLRETFDECNIDSKRGIDLLIAFRQDAIKPTYSSWDDLAGYCKYSANPVGQFLLDLHGEAPEKYVYSDALCTVLQVLNHLQDCGDDLREIDRCYVPQDWMKEYGTQTNDLLLPKLTSGMSKVVHLMLDRVEDLLVTARQLPGALSDRRLAMESAVIVKLAQRLTKRLRRQDPLAERVSLSKIDFALAGMGGVIGGTLKLS